VVAVRRGAATFALFALGAAATSGCGNATGFLDVPKHKKPVAVISGPPGPLSTLGSYLADGSASHDPDGQVVAWHWTVFAHPDGSQLVLTPDASAPNGSKVNFRPDLVGSYEIRLVVTDNDGLDSDPAVYDFDTADTQGLRLELTWDMNYVDVDLHLIDESAGGTFFTSPYDCYFQNKSPDWGLAGNNADDPLLPFDADEGFGPEVMGIPAPAAGTYHAMAHYYCDDGFGGTQATVKLFLHGVLAAETHAQLTHTGDLWDVATVVVDSAGNAALTVSTSGLGTSSHGCG